MDALCLFYPVLLCLIPVHSLFAQNVGEIAIKDYYRALIIVTAIVAAGCSGLNFFINDIYTSEAIFCINFFAILYANYVFIGLFSQYKRTLNRIKFFFCISYIILSVIISVLFYLFVPKIIVIAASKTMFFIAGIISLFVILDIMVKLSKFKCEKPEKAFDNVENNKDYPDIYHILADGHCGFFNPKYCDEEFKKGLEQRGFCICQLAKSNYNFTHLSVPSMLNMDYVYNFISREKTLLPVKCWPFYAKNKVFDELKTRGYLFNFVFHRLFINMHRYNYIGKNDTINTYISSSNSITAMMCFSSIFRFFITKSKKLNYKHDIEDLLARYKKMVKVKTNQPVYNYMHILAPHPPYFKEENGNDLPLLEQNNPKHYGAYQKFINKKYLSLIDEIKKNMKPNSIILIHSDHSLFEENNINMTYHILFALYFPEKYKYDNIPQDITLANSFRYLFNEIFKDNYPILNNEFYKTKPYEYKIEKLDVTENF